VFVEILLSGPSQSMPISHSTVSPPADRCVTAICLIFRVFPMIDAMR
jgi:hypothetical protein